MWGRIRQVLIKEFIQVFRNPQARFMLVLPPVLQMIIFGYAATYDVHHVKTAIYDQDHSQESRELVSHFVDSGYFQITDSVRNRSEVAGLIDQGKVTLVLQILPGFSEDLRKPKGASLQVILDGTDSNTALIALGYISQIGQQFAQRYSTDFMLRTSPSMTSMMPSVTLEQRPWFNPNLESQWFFVPGTIGTLTLTLVLTMTAFAIVREREIGTLEQIMVTPIHPFEFIFGKTLPYLLIALGQLLLVMIIGIFWFRVPFTGSVTVLVLGSILFVISIIGVGILISTMSATQQQAMVVSFFFIMPAITLSGFAFPISSMPSALKLLTYLDPLRYYLVLLRSTFLKGAGFATLWPQLITISAFAVVLLSVSVSRWTKILD